MKFKKFLCALLGISMCGMSILSAVATEYEDIDRQDGYQMDFEPLSDYEPLFSLEEIMQMSDAERERLELSSPSILFNHARNATDYSLAVPTYQQTEKHYCGPAAVLQLLAAEGKYDAVRGSTVKEKQDTLAEDLKTTLSGTSTSMIVNVLNSYVSRVREWEMMHVDENDSKDILLLKFYMDSNFSNGHPTIYMVYTESLGYYGKRKSYHFVTGSGIIYETGLSSDDENIKMLIVDPHYDSKLSGKHEVPFKEMIKGMTGTTGENFVY